MPKEKIQIEFNENDLKELIAEKYNLNKIGMSLSVTHFAGDQRDPEYTSIKVTAEKLNNNNLKQ